MKKSLILAVTLFSVLACSTVPKNRQITTAAGAVEIIPVRHGSLVMKWDGKVIYVDPAWDAALYKDLPAADLVLITDIHFDHLNQEVLKTVLKDTTVILAPKAVMDKMNGIKAARVTLMNTQEADILGLNVMALPMYNLSKDRLQFHEKGRGNGYLITAGGSRIYISGDTEDIPEMRELKDIDAAFICMNLPYTMTPEQAAEGVKAFKPAVVYPYHFRNPSVNKKGNELQFKNLLQGTGIEVRLLKWYPD